MSSAAKVIKAASSVISGIDSIAEREKLLDLVRELEESEDEIKDLKRRNEALGLELKRRKDLELTDNGYHVIAKDGGTIGPVCPTCYKETGFVFNLLQVREGAKCTVCGNVYPGVTSEYRQSGGKVHI